MCVILVTAAPPVAGQALLLHASCAAHTCRLSWRCCRSIAERLKASDSFQCLITSRQLPTQPFLYKLAEVPCQFSYSLHGRAYIYVKSLREAPAAVLAKVLCRDGMCWLPGMGQMQLGIAVDELLSANDPGRFVQVSPAVLAAAAGVEPVVDAFTAAE